MADKSKIEWTDASWNPVTGCTKITRGCDHCYAETLAERFRGTPGHAYEQGFDLTLRPGRMDQPLRWRKPRMIFVNSMSDLFHKEIPEAYKNQIFDVMEQATHHVFQVLTKRSSLMRNYCKKRYAEKSPPPHIWLGVSVEDHENRSRVRHLRETPAEIRFLSIEPLLGPVGELDLEGIHWVIVGGESGALHRPMKEEWVLDIQKQCDAQNTHFFFKQWGGATAKAQGRTLRGKIWDAMPAWPTNQNQK